MGCFCSENYRKWVPPLKMKMKNPFIWLHGHVTWELEMKGREIWVEVCFGQGLNGICTWESIGIPKPTSVSLGVLDAYLSDVLHKTLPQVASNTPKSWTVLDASLPASYIRHEHIQRPTTQRVFFDIFGCFWLDFWLGLGLDLGLGLV